jgi:hypothetical protein
MDNKKLLRLARLRSVAAKANLPFDLMRFTDDRDYAAECLRKLMDSSNEELLVLCLEVKSDMFPPAAAPAPASLPAPKATERSAVDQRYVGRLR